MDHLRAVNAWKFSNILFSSDLIGVLTLDGMENYGESLRIELIVVGSKMFRNV
jgi:hypothetical protein